MSIKRDPLFQHVGAVKSGALYSGSSHCWSPMDFHRGALWQRAELPHAAACPRSLVLHWDHRKKGKRS